MRNENKTKYDALFLDGHVAFYSDEKIAVGDTVLVIENDPLDARLGITGWRQGDMFEVGQIRDFLGGDFYHPVENPEQNLNARRARKLVHIAYTSEQTYKLCMQAFVEGLKAAGKDDVNKLFKGWAVDAIKQPDKYSV